MMDHGYFDGSWGTLPTDKGLTALKDALARRRLRDSDGSPEGRDAERGSIACDDSAGPKDIAQ